MKNLRKPIPVKLVNWPNSVGMLPERLLTTVFGNIEGTSDSERTQVHLEQ